MTNSMPYVVTDDLEIVFSYLQRRGISLPSASVIKSASQKVISALSEVFPKVDAVEASRISDYLNAKASLSSLPAVSLTGLLDDKFATAALHFSRSVRRSSGDLGSFGYKSIGVMPRTAKDLGYGEQLDLAARIIKQKFNRVALIDDVVFSGGTILSVTEEFAKRGVAVAKVIASVAIEGAIPKLAEQGITVDADVVYSNVCDEVCMRDFIVGAPEGGRNVISEDGYYEAAPYIEPFGDIQSWASIPPERCKEFSMIATRASLDIWEDIDRKNGRPILVGELAKPIVGLNVSESVVKQLKYQLGC